MTENKTLGQIKKRIFDYLDEYSETSGGVYVTDGNRETLLSRMPDAVSSSLVRMYESLAVGTAGADLELIRPKKIAGSLSLAKEGIVADIEDVSVGVTFGFYGSGRLVFENSDGEKVLGIECSGDGVKNIVRRLFTLPAVGRYTIIPEGNITVVGLAVYENDGITDDEALPPMGYMSVQLPQDFDRFLSIEGSEKYLSCILSGESEGYVHIDDGLFAQNRDISVTYKKRPPVISKSTSDDFVFELSSLAFEALICLSASELCREEEAGMYTRLLYKYSDLSEALYKSKDGQKSRNGFYRAFAKMR